MPSFLNPALVSNQAHFSQIPVDASTTIRSSFNRSSRRLQTMNMDYITPIFLDPVLPGDTLKMRPTIFARLNTPLVPFMDNIWMDLHFFFVPNRLVWEKWPRFMGERYPDPDSSVDFLIPQVVAPTSSPQIGYAVGSIFDYCGVRPGVADLSTNALYYRGYNLIYNDFYRDQNLQDSVPVNYTSDGPDDYTDYVLLRRGKRHDYFTSGLPWPQKGDPVLLPLGTSAPITRPGSAPAYSLVQVDQSLSATSSVVRAVSNNAAAAGSMEGDASTVGRLDAGAQAVYIDPNGRYRVANDDIADALEADLSDATSASVNDIREAVLVQHILELDARGGTRYIEILQSHWGVRSPDARLQRPEYLGGCTKAVIVNPIAQTAPAADGSTELGDLAAVGTVMARDGGFTWSATEHGFILGLVTFRADLTYQQGTERHHFYTTRYDFYDPIFNGLGEQAVFNREIFTQGPTEVDPISGLPVDELAFCYQEYGAENKYKPSSVAGLFRSDAVGSLDSWHLSEDFETLPLFNSTFIQSDTPIERVVAVPSQPIFKVDSLFDYTCVRKMPVYNVPGIDKL